MQRSMSSFSMFALHYRTLTSHPYVARGCNRASIARHYLSLYYVTRLQVKTKQPKYDKNVSLPMNVYLLTHFLLSIMASDLLTSHIKVKAQPHALMAFDQTSDRYNYALEHAR